MKLSEFLKNKYPDLLQKYEIDDIKFVIKKLNVDNKLIKQFIQGLRVELEHGKISKKTNVTNNNLLVTGKIALAHLNELPDYYTRLKKIEEQEARNSVKSLNHVKIQDLIKSDVEKKADCQIWNFALLFEIAYEDAINLLKKHGWHKRHPWISVWIDAITELGKINQFSIIKDDYYDRKDRKISVKKLIDILPKDEKYAIVTHNHIFSYINGKVYDVKTTPPYSLVYAIFRIGKSNYFKDEILKRKLLK